MTAAPISPSAALSAGDTLDTYRIVAPLKTGGMARLYLARREGAAGFSKPVAIKVIHPHLANESDFIERFIAEARLSASIAHPNVVHVESLGEATSRGGMLYIAMEYVHGISLADVMSELSAANRALSPKAAAFIASRVALGLHSAHETKDPHGRPLGIIHRDISPQNILVAFSGQVKVIDFGIAKAAFDVRKTRDSSIYGKLAYMAPEQARGNEEIDRRADIFALGVVLWELLTRKHLFKADNDIAQLLLLETKNIEPPSTFAPEVSPALDTVVMKALAREREDRYATAGEMARALADAVPDIRGMEPEDLSALLTAIAPKELEKKQALLASVGSSEIAATATESDPIAHEATTNVRLKPDEALAQLTLPVPSQILSMWPAAEENIHEPLASSNQAGTKRSNVGLILVGLVPVAIILLLIFGWRLMRPTTATPAETSTPPTHPPPPPPPPSLSGPPEEPSAAPSASAATAASAPAASAPSAPSAPASASASAPRVSGKKPKAPKPPASATTTNKQKCRTIDGIELCQ